MATLRTFDLTKSYGGRTVVRGINLEVSSGEVVGLLGPNGAGKTTTFYMTVGLVAPDSGRVELNGADVTDDPMYVRARKGIGYLPQEASIFRGLTVEQNIMAILETMDMGAADRRARSKELLAELNRELAGVYDGFRIVAIHMEDRRLNHLRDVGRVWREARLTRRRSEADLVVDDDVNRSAGAIAGQLRKSQSFGNDSLPRERSIAMQRDRDDAIAILVVHVGLLGAHDSLHDGIHEFQM